LHSPALNVARTSPTHQRSRR